MRRIARFKYAKKPRKRKGPKLAFSEQCDVCGKDLPVCRVREDKSAYLAVAAGSPATFSGDGLPVFFCSFGCLKQFAISDV